MLDAHDVLVRLALFVLQFVALVKDNDVPVNALQLRDEAIDLRIRDEDDFTSAIACDDAACPRFDRRRIGCCHTSTRK